MGQIPPPKFATGEVIGFGISIDRPLKCDENIDIIIEHHRRSLSNALLTVLLIFSFGINFVQAVIFSVKLCDELLQGTNVPGRRQEHGRGS